MRAVKEEPHGFAVDSFMKIFSCRSMYMLCVNSVHTVYSVYYTPSIYHMFRYKTVGRLVVRGF